MYAYQLVIMSKYDPLATVHVLHRSTSSTMILYLTYFISIGWLLPLQTKTRISTPSVSVSLVEGDGTTSIGGTNPHMFAEDGETSYLGQHPSWVFTSFVHLARL